MHRYAEGTLGSVEKPLEFPLTTQYFSCVAMPRDPWEMLTKTIVEFLVKTNIARASLCRENLGNVDKSMEFLAKTNIFHASLCRGNPRNVEKPLEFHMKINICHASPCRGIPPGMLKNHGSSL